MASIAVIDDVPANRELLVTVLSAMGHDCQEAADGAAALVLVKSTLPDLVICDVLMPVMDGYEFMRLLRLEPALSAIPVIFYTAHYFEEDAKRLARSCGVSDFLSKPCEPEDILRVVQRVLSLETPAPAEALTGEFESRHLELLTDKLTQKVRDLERANQRLAEQHERILRLNRMHAVLSGINSAIVHVRNRRRLLQEACRIAVEAGNFGMAWIGELSESGTEVRAAAWAGMNDMTGAKPAALDSPQATSPLGRALSSGQPVVVSDLEQEHAVGPRLTEALRRGYRSAIFLPLTVQGQVMGVLCLYVPESAFFNTEEMELLVELAGDVSYALEFIGQQERLAWMSHHDLLTGLSNRNTLLERTHQAIQAARQHGWRLGVAAIDVDRFRHVNTSLGRPAGDTLLKDMARRLATAWPQADHVARLGSNEFGTLVAEAEDFPQIAHVLERAMLATFGRPFSVDGQELRLAAACGVAIYPDDGEDAETLFRNAEAALRRAKEGNLPYAFYRPDMNARVTELLMLESRLRRAVDREEFVLHYQPKQNLESRRTTSFEALIRWNDPENGLIPPDEFVHLLEETGLILTVGAWAIRRVLEDGQRWLSNGVAPPRIAVNVSPIQLLQADFIESTREALAVLHSEQPWMDLELTESMIMNDIEHNVRRLHTLRGMGLGIAIDDFGTGYSSLGYLTRLPVNALKIDRSFIVTMMSSPESMSIVSTIITLAHALGMKVIAEGVEQEEQARMLRLLKCDELQGFLLSPAVPPDRMREFLHA